MAPRLAVTSLTHCEDSLPPQERGSSPEPRLHHGLQHVSGSGLLNEVKV